MFIGCTKHIDIRHHFLRDHKAKGDISLQVLYFGETFAQGTLWAQTSSKGLV